MSSVSLPDEVRAACAWVARHAKQVGIDESAIEAYALGLPDNSDGANPAEDRRDPEAVAAFAICMNAINFGSGWWPTVRKRLGHSGYATMAAGVEECFDRIGHWTPGQLAVIDAETIAGVLGQDPEHPLMAQFAAALCDIGAHVQQYHDGRFLGVIEAADSIPALAGILASWDSFADTSTYEGRKIPFFKRAQLAAADLHRAGVADLAGLDRLTAFADNLVPHVLSVDGVLRLSPELEAQIEAGDLLLHGSPEEVELRACAVHAVEILAGATGHSVTPAEIDSVLWNRGRDRRYKTLPRPRCRNSAY